MIVTKIAAVIMFALGVLLGSATTSQAITLEITEGSVLFRAVGFNGVLSGDGVSIVLLGGGFGYAGFPPIEFTLTLYDPTGLSHNQALVTVGDEFCVLGLLGSSVGQPGYHPGPCGVLHFSSPEPFEAGPFSEPHVTPPVPFTLSGSLEVGGTHYDLAGQGSLVGLYCIHTICDETGVNQRSAALRYDFAVPEPATWLLMVAGVAVLIAALRRPERKPEETL